MSENPVLYRVTVDTGMKTVPELFFREMKSRLYFDIKDEKKRF